MSDLILWFYEIEVTDAQEEIKKIAENTILVGGTLESLLSVEWKDLQSAKIHYAAMDAERA